MTVDIDRLLSDLEENFQQRRDRERAAGATAYMRNRFDFYGIGAPDQRKIASDVTRGTGRPSESELRRVALACWQRNEREWQYFACGYLRRHIAVASPRFITTARKLVATKSWWDTVDSLASRTVGPLVLAHPELVATMDDWIGDRDIWIARTAILHQLSYKSATDAERLFRYCLARSADREFFIRKAIGWALREYSKTDATAVRRFVADHSDDLSGLSSTEALKWLERKRARSALARGDAPA